MSAVDVKYQASKTIADFMRCDAFFRGLIGPVGGGKSVGCSMEVLRRCIEMAPGPDGLRKSRWAIIRNTRQQLKDTTLKTFLDWITPGVLGRWKESEMTFEMRFNDVHADILFRPLDSPEDVQRVLSLELSGAWINESREVPIEIVEAVMSRIGRYPKREDVPEYWCGLIADTNPPEIDSSWHKIFEKLPLEEGNENSVMECESFAQPSGLSPEAENKQYLRPNYYEDLARGKTKAWVDTYIHGKYSPSQAGKPVYATAFKRERHVSPTPLPIHPTLPVIIGFDTGMTPALLFSQVGMDGRVRRLREIAAFDMGMERCVINYVRPMVRNTFPTNTLIFIGDPAAVRRGDGDENTALKVLKQYFSEHNQGVNVFKTAFTNDPDVRIQATEKLLVQYPEGDPMLIIDPSCKRYRRGLQSMYRYQRIKSTGGYADVPQKTGEPGTYTHLVEAGQYSDLYILSGKYRAEDFIVAQAPHDPLGFFSNNHTMRHGPAQAEGY